MLTGYLHFFQSAMENHSQLEYGNNQNWFLENCFYTKTYSELKRGGRGWGKITKIFKDGQNKVSCFGNGKEERGRGIKEVG